MRFGRGAKRAADAEFSAARDLFEANLELIEKVCRVVCRRKAVYGADAEDFSSLVKVKLLENDCARLQQFTGQSTFKTFLTTVVLNLLRDERNHQWGKFRPSVAARRLGTTAVQLEILRYRDGLELEEAVQVLSVGSRVAETPAELRQLAAQLPEKASRHLVPVEDLGGLPAPRQEDPVARQEREQEARRTAAALRAALGRLSPAEQVLLKLNLQDGLSVATIARTFGEVQRRLYTRLETAFRRLGADLEQQGIRAADALDAIGWDGWQDLFPGGGAGNSDAGPSSQSDGEEGSGGHHDG